MEEYYNKNYNRNDVYESTNIFQERIWGISYDEKYDLLYIFNATINQMKGEMLAEFIPGMSKGKGKNVLNAKFAYEDEPGIKFNIND